MAKYLLKRILLSFLTIFLILLATFFLMEAVPGTPVMDRRMQEKLGLNDPLLVKCVRYMTLILTGDFGTSMSMHPGASVFQILFRWGKLELTMKLGGVSLLLSIVLGTLLGCTAVQFKDRMPDHFVRVMSTLGASLPMPVITMFIMVIFVVKLKLFSVLSMNMEKPIQWVLPVLCLSIINIFNMARIVRTSILDVAYVLLDLRISLEENKLIS